MERQRDRERQTESKTSDFVAGSLIETHANYETSLGNEASVYSDQGS